MAAMGGAGGGARGRAVGGSGGNENIAHLKHFMATMDPVIVPPEFPEPIKREKVKEEVVQEEVVVPTIWVKGAFKEPLIAQEQKKVVRLKVLTELEHPLAHVGDPKRRISLKNLTAEEAALVDNAIDAANTARLLAAERNRIRSRQAKKNAEQKQAKELVLKNLSEHVREEAAEKRRAREAEEDEALALSRRKEQGGKRLSEAEEERLQMLLVRLANRQQGMVSSRSGHMSARSPAPSARSLATTTGGSSTQSAGAVILSPRGTTKHLWTPRSSRSARSEFEDASARSTPWSTPFSSPRFKSSATPRTPRTGWDTPRSSQWTPRNPRLLEDTASSRFRFSGTPSQTPRTARAV